MTRKGLAIVTILLVAAMIAAGLALGAALPADRRLPIHWGLSGVPDAYGPKWLALLLPAVFTAAIGLLFYFLPRLEPRGQGLERSHGLYLWLWASGLMMGAVVALALSASALGWNLPVGDLVMGAIGLMLMMIGNQLGKSRSMYLAGIRTPWTLASEEVWVRTNRLGGKLMLGAGLVTIVAAVLPLSAVTGAVVAGGAIAVAATVPIAYSWLLWRREGRADQSSR